MSISARMATLAALISLSACGSFAPNSDVPPGIHTGMNRPVIADNEAIKLVRSAPPSTSGGKDVSGTSCKNKIWEADPSAENAIALMKRQAAKLGMNVVYVASVGNDPTALVMNCWSAITATGIAFKEDLTQSAVVQTPAKRR